MLLAKQLRQLFTSILLVLPVVVSGADDLRRTDFPRTFIFGAGSSAYQVEGAAFEDGRMPSIWDTFAHAGVYGGANADVSCDAYHKYKEDVKLMADTGPEGYRYSISWSRLIPNGRGPVNPRGLQYYNNLINELLSHDTDEDSPPGQIEYPVNQPGLRKILEYLKQAYGNLPIYIHENGQLTRRNETLNDTSRVEYLQAYMGNLLDAIRNSHSLHR